MIKIKEEWLRSFYSTDHAHSIQLWSKYTTSPLSIFPVPLRFYFDGTFRKDGSRFTAVKAEGLWLDNCVFPVVNAADILHHRPWRDTKTSRFLFPFCFSLVYYHFQTTHARTGRSCPAATVSHAVRYRPSYRYRRTINIKYNDPPPKKNTLPCVFSCGF